MEITVNLARPKRMPKRRTTPISRPDIDNYLKQVLDALTGFAFRDDSLVCQAWVAKQYCPPDQPVGVAIVISWLEP